jgi:hypothetical protein
MKLMVRQLAVWDYIDMRDCPGKNYKRPWRKRITQSKSLKIILQDWNKKRCISKPRKMSMPPTFRI